MKNRDNVFNAAVDSRYGLWYVEADETGVTALFPEKMRTVPQKRTAPLGSMQQKILEQADRELKEYFRGERTKFETPIHLEGTEFQKQVWEALRKIPYGETRCYSEVAQMIGKPRACRAVGGANNRNPILLMIPCHRVIGKDGSMVGFAADVSLKEKLLRMEAGKDEKTYGSTAVPENTLSDYDIRGRISE